MKPIGVPAWDFIISVAASLRGELTMFAVGPLTNVAKALLKQPRVASWIKHLYIMGGAIDCPGNTTPNAEFNIWDDADAAQMVLNSGIPITLVGLDVTNKVLLRREEDWWRRSRSRTGLLAGRVVRNWLRRHPERAGMGSARSTDGGRCASPGGDDVQARLGVCGNGRGRDAGQDDRDVR